MHCCLFAAFVIYVILIVITVMVLIFWFSRPYGQSNPMVYVTITSTIGSLSVMGCKGLGVALKQTMAGNSQLTNWLTWFIIFSVAFCITIQMNYLNKALDIFNTAVVTPMLYVIFKHVCYRSMCYSIQGVGPLGSAGCCGKYLWISNDSIGDLFAAGI